MGISDFCRNQRFNGQYFCSISRLGSAEVALLLYCFTGSTKKCPCLLILPFKVILTRYHWQCTKWSFVLRKMAWNCLDRWQQSFTTFVPSRMCVTAAPSSSMVLDYSGHSKYCQPPGQMGISPCSWEGPYRYHIYTTPPPALLPKLDLQLFWTCGHCKTLIANIFLTFSICPPSEGPGANNAFKKTNASMICFLSTLTRSMTTSLRSQLPSGITGVREALGCLAQAEADWPFISPPWEQTQ